MGSCPSDRIDPAIKRMKETRELEELTTKWATKGSKCPDPEGSSLPVRRKEGGVTFLVMGPRDLAVPFLVLFLGGLLAAGVAALEVLNDMGYFNVSSTEGLQYRA